jgi:hypothetical protein
VIPLNARWAALERRFAPPPADSPGDEQAAEFWRSVFAQYGLTLDEKAPVEDVLKIVAERMEAMVTGLLYLREGGGPRDLAPDAEAGIDYIGAREVVGLLREMKSAPAVVRGDSST